MQSGRCGRPLPAMNRRPAQYRLLWAHTLGPLIDAESPAIPLGERTPGRGQRNPGLLGPTWPGRPIRMARRPAPGPENRPPSPPQTTCPERRDGGPDPAGLAEDLARNI